jgi:hypothetical protein
MQTRALHYQDGAVSLSGLLVHDDRAIYNSAKAGTKKPRTMPGLKVCWR